MPRISGRLAPTREARRSRGIILREGGEAIVKSKMPKTRRPARAAQKIAAAIGEMPIRFLPLHRALDMRARLYGARCEEAAMIRRKRARPAALRFRGSLGRCASEAGRMAYTISRMLIHRGR